ncbi:MAG TPA: hypothetical protein VFF48_03115 [Brevundimonas sp.]|nr:hypothetical protein [Brevundimonas sp.]
MSVSYPGEPYRNEPISPYTPRDGLRLDDRVERPALDRSTDEPFVPVYARRGKAARRGGGQVRTWMILAPVGLLVLGGATVAMMMSGEERVAAPLAETSTPLPATTALAATLPTALPVIESPAPVEAAPAAVRKAPTPVPARRAATTRPEPVAALTATPASTPAPATSPTVTLNTAPVPMATPAPMEPVPSEPSPPVILVQPPG